MSVKTTDLPGVLLIEPNVFSDERGFFLETYQALRYKEKGIASTFVQSNLSRSRKGTLRGLHFQLGQPQAKLVTVVRGKVFDVAVDVRQGSPNFGKWVGFELSDENHWQLYIPEGFAHGFYAMSEEVDFIYDCSNLYSPTEERGIRWDDPDLRINWPEGDRVVSPRDNQFPMLKDMSGDLPLYKEGA